MVESLKNYQTFHKLIIFGDKIVGKSSLVQLLRTDSSRVDYIPSECII